MKTKSLKPLLLSLLLSSFGCSVTQLSTPRTDDLPKISGLQVQNTPPEAKRNEILSMDYFVAEKRLATAVLENDNETVGLGLKSPILSFRIKTVETIAKIDDDRFVPKLIVALEENQSHMDGGSETKSFQSILNTSIISTLEKFTKLRFKVSNPPTKDQIKEVINKSKNWCETNKKDI